MDDLLSEFLTETNESLATLDVELVKLEQDPNQPGLINSIFRLVHTIKGTCGFLGLPRLEKVARSGENVLGKIRDGAIAVTPEAVSLILRALDRIKELLGVLAATEHEPEGSDAELIAELDAMAASSARPAASVPGPTPAPVPVDASATAGPTASVDPGLGRELKPGEVSLEELERVFQATAGPLAAAVEPAPAAGKAAAEPAAATTPAGANRPTATPESAQPEVGNQNIRVSVDLLETLMTMVSELALTRNQLMQIVREHTDSEFKVPLQRLSHVTTELQEGVMKTRMQPIGNAWAKLPRIIRDLGRDLGKKIDLQMLGADTELDRQVLELIKDPLTHMVRNSADHGLETTAERIAAGKPEVGRVVLNAYHEGGHIIIEIKDDSCGINVARVRQKIVESGLAGAAEVETLSDQQVCMYIFKPGLSTAQKVTNVSGRGVGMDVVRTNIEEIGGTIDMKSVQGAGTAFTIKIPLKLAIVSALIVECRGERFAVPQISVIELVRASREAEHRIETINRTPVLRLRDRLLPLVYLSECLKLVPEVYVVVAQVGSYRFGIVVDRVFDTEEIVVKPVAPILRGISLFSGNTILGDGSVIMILDPNGIAAASTGAETQGGQEEQAAQSAAKRGSQQAALLLFQAGGTQPKAVPLSLVARLEEVEVGAVEQSNGCLLVQYRGRLMPLITLDSSYGLKSEGRQPILVFADGDRNLGLLVDQIVDIVGDELNVQIGTERPGFLGSAVIAGKATEIIDVGKFLNQGFADWFGRNVAFGEKETGQRLLLVDDSSFFHNLLKPLLEVAGYKVTTAENADAALHLREEGEAFDIIISDIEMPGMSGFEFVSAVRQEGPWQRTPVVALSSHATPKDFERGRQAGFDDYVPKLDRDALLATLNNTLERSKEAA